MRLVVLGGAAAGPTAAQGCSGYYVECGQARLVLDLGPGTLPELLRYTKPSDLDAILISHLHVDHVLDLISLSWGLIHAPSPCPIPVWLPPGSEEFLKQIAAAFLPGGAAGAFFSPFKLAEYDPTRPLAIRDALVRFAPTVHYVPGWAMRVDDGVSRALVYSSDTGPAAALESFAHGAAVIIAESMLLEPTSELAAQRSLSTPTEAARLARAAAAELLILTHLSPTHSPRCYRDQAQEIFQQVTVARPGLTVTW